MTDEILTLRLEYNSLVYTLANEQKIFKFGSESADECLAWARKRLEYIKTQLDLAQLQIDAGDIVPQSSGLLSRFTRKLICGGGSGVYGIDMAAVRGDIKDTKSGIMTVSKLREKFRSIFALALYGVFLSCVPTQSTGSEVPSSAFLDHPALEDRHPSEQMYAYAESLYKLSTIITSVFSSKRSDKGSDFVRFIKEREKFGQELAAFFEKTLNVFIEVPHASNFARIISSATQIVLLVVGLMSRAQQRFQIARSDQKTALKTHFQIWEDELRNLQAMGTPKHVIASRGRDEILEEIQLWNQAVAEDAHGSSVADPFHISANAFTYENLSSKMATALCLEILKTGPPSTGRAKEANRGGFARIFEVELPDNVSIFDADGRLMLTTRKVAVKVTMPVSDTPAKAVYTKENATCARILREMRIWSRMKHENIVPLLGLWSNFSCGGMTVPHPVAVAPWMEDGDLHDFLNANPCLSFKRRLTFMREIVSALVYMHNHPQHRVIHGDLKANNVLVKDGKAYLCDFGLSSMLDGVSGQSSNIHANPRWAAPELINSFEGRVRKPTRETDMYAYGSTFLEVITEDWPWTSGVSDSFVLETRRKNPLSVPERPKSVAEDSKWWDLMQRCWRVDPILRPTSKQVLKFVDELILASENV